MKTTTIGLRLNDYQLEKLNKIAEGYGLHRMDLLRVLLEGLIDGKIVVSDGKVVGNDYDLSAYERLAEKKRISVQGLLDLISEELGA